MAGHKIYMPHWPLPVFKDLHGTPVERTRLLLEKMGDPQNNLPPVIHVSGTNGKGSTIAFLKTIFEEGGYKIHTYTSPHLFRFNERIVIGGTEIEDGYLYEILERTRVAAGDTETGFFEATTAAAYLAFSENKADFLLVETGIGGIFDATNIIEEKLLTIITTVSRDHENVLGRDLREIAWHKSGIMRKDTPCVVSYQMREIIEVVLQEVKKIGAIPNIFGKNWVVSAGSTNHDSGFKYIDSGSETNFPVPGLIGDHQIINAGNAIAAIKTIFGESFPNEKIARGLMKAEWSGRMEKIESGDVVDKLPEGWELWFDGGHNMAAGYAISEIIKEWRDKPVYMICGTTKGKDIAGFLLPFRDRINLCCGVRVLNEVKCYSAGEVAEAARNVGINSVACDTLEEAVDYILEKEKSSLRIIVFGSLFLRAEI